MPLTNAGRDALAQAIIGSLATLFDNANAYIGVGTSNTAFGAAQTDLQGSNTYREGQDDGYPSITGNVITFKSTFGGSVANFAWEEWGIFNDASAGTMLNRKVEYNGTKQSGQTWIFETDITVSIGS